jgi:Arc/MetJ-type ribon-helix-helix transcriptional regulator
MRAKTIGFAIADDDRELLERLVNHYGQGNRSEFLRVAMKRMEHDRLAARFIETRRAIDEELGGKVFSEAEIDQLIATAAKRAS